MKVDRYGQDKVETVNVDVISSIAQNCGMREAITQVLSAQKGKICTKPHACSRAQPVSHHPQSEFTYGEDRRREPDRIVT